MKYATVPADPRVMKQPVIIETTEVSEYHAHVYFDEGTRTVAAWLRDELAVRFQVKLGRWKNGAVGPHPMAMYQVAFDPRIFYEVVAWLMLNRRDLNVLIHPNSGHGHAGDHAYRAIWLGEPLPLDIAFLEQTDAQGVEAA